MLDPSFYDYYADYDYMLICQPDAYVFRDELQEWVNKGYHYVGASWIPTEFYWKRTWGVLRQRVRRLFKLDYAEVPQYFKYFAVGNGGFSLRHIQTIRQIAVDDAPIISKANCFEDFYIGVVAPNTHPKLRIPHWKEALKFSFEQSLEHCYRLNNHQLPFGCHYWNRPKNYDRFWKRFISIE